MGHNQVDLADDYQASYRVGLENVNIHMMILTKLTYLVSWCTRLTCTCSWSSQYVFTVTISCLNPRHTNTLFNQLMHTLASHYSH